MHKLTIIQRNCFGPRKNRTSVLWVKADQLQQTIDRKSRAYNLANTDFIVD